MILLAQKRKSSRHGPALPFKFRISTNYIVDLESTFAGLTVEVVFMVDDGVCVLAIVFERVDLGVGNFAGAECSVVGRIGVLLIITGLDLLLRFVVLAGVFLPSLTEAGRGLVLFATGLTAGLAASVVVFFALLLLLTCVTFAAGLLTGFLSVFDGAIERPITGTATAATTATAAHLIQLFFMATPLSKIRPHVDRHGSWSAGGAA